MTVVSRRAMRLANRLALCLSPLAVMSLALAAPADAVGETEPVAETDAARCDGTVWWSELLSPETERLTEFYSRVIGWKSRVVDTDDQMIPPTSSENRYTIFETGTQHRAAGLMNADHPEAIHSLSGWFTYFQVEDIETAIQKVKINGGRVLRGPIETTEGNELALVRDPLGNVFGLVVPADGDSC